MRTSEVDQGGTKLVERHAEDVWVEQSSSASDSHLWEARSPIRRCFCPWTGSLHKPYTSPSAPPSPQAETETKLTMTLASSESQSSGSESV